MRSRRNNFERFNPKIVSSSWTMGRLVFFLYLNGLVASNNLYLRKCVYICKPTYLSTSTKDNYFPLCLFYDGIPS